jgi:hypothetical protein
MCIAVFSVSCFISDLELVFNQHEKIGGLAPRLRVPNLVVYSALTGLQKLLIALLLQLYNWHPKYPTLSGFSE